MNFDGICLDQTAFLDLIYIQGVPDSSVGKESTCNAGDPGSIPGSGRSPGEGIGYQLQHSGLENSMNGSPHQYSFLENSMDRGAWWATVHGVTKSQT